MSDIQDEVDLLRAVERMLRMARANGEAHAKILDMPESAYRPIMSAVTRYAQDYGVTQDITQPMADVMNVGLCLGWRWAMRDVAEFDGVIVVTLDGGAARQPIVPTVDDLRASMRPQSPATFRDVLQWIMGGAR